MILTNTRFRRRPSRLTCQPFRLALEDPLPGAKDFGEFSRVVEAAVGHRYHHGFAWRPMPLQVRVGVPVTPFRTGVLTGAVVQPGPGSARLIGAYGAKPPNHTSQS